MTELRADGADIGTRMLGVLGILGGLALVIAFVPALPWTHELFNLRLVLFNVGAIAVVIAVHRRQVSSHPRLSLATAVPVTLANAWYLVMIIASIGRSVFPEADPSFRQVFFYTAMALWLADAAFGFAAWRIGAVTRWGALALGVGSLLAGSGIGGLWFTTGPLSALLGPASLVGIGLVGIGWILLGADVAMGRRGVQPGPEAAGVPSAP